MRANTLARPEQTQSPEQQFPFFAHSGRHAAELWLAAAPLTMSDWRDNRYAALVAGLGFLSNPAGRRKAFDDGFTRRIAISIAAASHVEVAQ